MKNSYSISVALGVAAIVAFLFGNYAITSHAWSDAAIILSFALFVTCVVFVKMTKRTKVAVGLLITYVALGIGSVVVGQIQFEKLVEQQKEKIESLKNQDRH